MYSRLNYILLSIILILSIGCEETPTENIVSKDISTDDTNKFITWGGNSNDFGYTVTQTQDGGFAVAGSQYSATTKDDLYLIKFTSSGEIDGTEFTLDNDNSTNSNNQVNDLYQTDDGGYILVGNTYNDINQDQDIWVVKLASDHLTVEWDSTFAGSGSGKDEGNSIQQTDDGGYIISGSTFDSIAMDIWLIKLNENGTIKWDTTYSLYHDSLDFYDDFGNSVQQTQDGGFILTGTSYDTTNTNDIRLIKTNNLGVITWDTTYTRSDGNPQNDEGHYVWEVEGGNAFIVVGKTFITQDQYDIYVIKTDRNGSNTERNIFTSQYNDQAFDVEQTSDGGFILVGSRYSSTNNDVLAIKLDINLVEQWSRTYGTANDDEGRSVEQTDDGGFIITGSTWTDEKQFDIILIKTDKKGDAYLLGQ